MDRLSDVELRQVVAVLMAQVESLQKRLERLESMVAAGAKQLQSVYKMLTWILILVIVAVVLIWRPHF